MFCGLLMLNRWLHLFWLVLFAALLPMQGQTAATNIDAEPWTNTQEWQQSFPAWEWGQLAPEIENTSSTVIPPPITEVPQIGPRQGILCSPRWILSETHLENENDADVHHSGLDLAPCLNTSLMMVPEQWVIQPYQHFHASHRLSGWKETNAMYVALNSQYLPA